MAKATGEYRKKFRKDSDAALDAEIEAALSGVALDALYAADRAKPTSAGAPPVKGEKQSKRGRIVSITKDDVFVDFGGRSQGVVSQLQFEAEPKVGEEFDFFVDRYDENEGLLILNRKGAITSGVTLANLEVGQVVEGTVTGTNKGGLEVDVKGIRAFMPAGQVDLYHVPDLAVMIGQKVTAEVTQYEREGRNVILSRRNILEQEREKAKVKLIAELAEGQVRRGTVRSVLDFGAFVDLGGVDGLLHVSEMTFRRGIAPGEIVKVGDVVDVKIIKLDPETGKMSLSLKQARGIDPWLDAGERYSAGTTLTGRVVKLESFGAFIEAEEGVEGLLPISEISYQRIRHPSEVIKEGDTIKLVVLSVDAVQRRISFSLKQAGSDPWKSVNDRYATGTNVTGTVTRAADFGAFVELEAGLEGLIHISELGTQRVRAVTDVVKIGQSVTVRILEIDQENRRMGLSLKRAGEVAKPVVSATPSEPEKPKKPRPKLRGGLDF